MALILRHYRQLGLSERWTWDRFDRLCRQVGCTPHELAALIGMRECNNRNKQLSGSACILLAMLDQAWVRAKTGLIGPPVMPAHLLVRE